ncbi:MAG: 6-phosphofructokinase, partial [Cyanobacteriota bacterium]
GVAAVDLIVRGQFDCMVAWQNRRVVAVPLAEAVAQYRGVEVDGVLVATAMGLNTYVGELDPHRSPSPLP